MVRTRDENGLSRRTLRVDIELERGRKTGKVEKTGKETDEKEECVIGMSGENP